VSFSKGVRAVATIFGSFCRLVMGGRWFFFSVSHGGYYWLQ